MSKYQAIQMGLGVDFLGAKMSLGPGSTLKLWWETGPSGQEQCLGFEAHSNRTGEVVYLPFANIKGVKGQKAQPDDKPVVQAPPKKQSGNKKEQTLQQG